MGLTFVFASQTFDWSGMSKSRSLSDIMRNLNGRECILETEAISAQNLFIASCVQVGKTLAEFNFSFIHGQRPVRTFAFGFHFIREMIIVDTQKPVYPGSFK